MHQLFNNTKLNYKNYILIKEYKKGTLIFNEGDVCNYLSLIIDGCISISTITNNYEYEITNLSKNSFFGENLLFSSSNLYLGDVIAYTDTKLALISKKDLLYLLRDEDILKNYLKLLSDKALNNQFKLKILSQKSIRNKIIFYIENEIKIKGSNLIKIESKEKLSKLLNIPRPSLSRELINLKNDGIIEFNKHYIRLL